MANPEQAPKSLRQVTEESIHLVTRRSIRVRRALALAALGVGFVAGVQEVTQAENDPTVVLIAAPLAVALGAATSISQRMTEKECQNMVNMYRQSQRLDKGRQDEQTEGPAYYTSPSRLQKGRNALVTFFAAGGGAAMVMAADSKFGQLQAPLGLAGGAAIVTGGFLHYFAEEDMSAIETSCIAELDAIAGNPEWPPQIDSN